MSVLDAYALISFLGGEPAGESVTTLLRRERGNPRISAVNLIEVYDRLARTHGVPFATVASKIGLLVRSGLEVVALDGPAAERAAELRTSHYEKGSAELSLADCAAAATAEILSEPLATADPALARMCRSAGIEVIPLPDSRGERP